MLPSFGAVGGRVILAVWAMGAWAFGGGYVGAEVAPAAPGGTVAYAWDGTGTAITWMPRAQGGTGAYALVVPLPANPGPEALRTVAPDSVHRALEFSSPRLLAFTCEDLHPFNQNPDYYGYYYYYYDQYVYTGDRTEVGPFYYNTGRGPLFCGPQGCGSRWYGPYGYWTTNRPPPPPDSGVDSGGDTDDPDETVGDVVAALLPEGMISASYDAAVLPADTRADLDQWFLDRSLVPTAEQSLLFDGLVGEGRAFLVAAVSQSVPGDGALPPLQVRLDGRVQDLPLALGQLNSPGSQDVTLLLLDSTAQRTEISGWTKAAVGDACMLRVDDDAEFSTAYETEFTAAINEAPAAWAVEFDGSTGACDPCVGAGALSAPVLADLGIPPALGDVHLTRLHLRYQADVVEPLGFVQVPDDAMSLGFVQYERDLEADFPICGEGFVEDPVACPEPFRSRRTGPFVPRPFSRGVLGGGLLLVAGVWLRRRFGRA